MKKKKVKKQILEELRKSPNIQVACEKTHISRQTFYRWLKEDIFFKSEAEQAQEEGINFMNDFVESKLMGNIQKSDTKSIFYYLDRNHPKYKPLRYRPPSDHYEARHDKEATKNFFQRWGLNPFKSWKNPPETPPE